jgi:hypothetical protein
VRPEKLTAEASRDSLRKGKQELIAKSDEAVRQQAENVAVQALAYIGSDPARLAPFLCATGLEPQAIRAAAGAPGFLAGILDYLAADERLLRAFAQETGQDPAAIMRAREILGGGRAL